MATAGISNDYYLASTQKSNISAAGDNSSMGKDAFLKILITQLQNQDPTEPMDDKQFISQMAQFSSLEQMQNMTTSIQDLVASQNETQLMSYTTFIGKEVKWHEVTSEFDSNGNYIVNEGTGVINELKFRNGEPIFILEEGKEISAGNISSILQNSSTSTVSENPLVAASQLIGQTVQYQKDGQQLTAKIEAVSTNNSLIEYILNDIYGTRLQKDQFALLSE